MVDGDYYIIIKDKDKDSHLCSVFILVCLFIVFVNQGDGPKAVPGPPRPETKDGPSELIFPHSILSSLIHQLCLPSLSTLPRTSSSLPHGHQGGL